MSAAHRCLAGCGKVITWRFAICADCERIYGAKPAYWPDWLQFLWRDTQRERRLNRKQAIYEVSAQDGGYRLDGKLPRHESAE